MQNIRFSASLCGEACPRHSCAALLHSEHGEGSISAVYTLTPKTAFGFTGFDLSLCRVLG